VSENPMNEDLPVGRRVPAYLFGMGHRRKLVYQAGAVLDAGTGEQLAACAADSEAYDLTQYRVQLEAREGGPIAISEDEEGVWIEQGGARRCLTAAPVRLPSFAGHPQVGLLRALHQEILVNITPDGPLPNLFVYDRPWYRDAAMVCMVLAKTGNLPIVRDWILGLREPFDRNNGGHEEPDNLGQLLYMISLVSNKEHPLVKTVLEQVLRFKRDRHIVGLTDGAEHPVYQTKWLKFGLRSLGLPDPFEIPCVYDSYSALFWWDYKRAHVPGPRFDLDARRLYPYLGWAEDHFYGDPPDMERLAAGGGKLDGFYPLTWEAEASEADYRGMARFSEQDVQDRICRPHTWHAAEMFLYALH